MNGMRRLALAAALAGAFSSAAWAQLGIGINAPGVSIGINMPAYPQLVRIPGYPVYWDPRAPANYFFYDGRYWVFADDNWYTSEWYNGPWRLVMPEFVPLYVLRVPVRYYRYPPPYFRAWRHDAPPRWGEYWGREWAERHHGWDRWDHRVVPPPAPLPHYQRSYSGDRYPSIEQQRALHERQYTYRPHEGVDAHPQRRFDEPHREAPRQEFHPQRPQPHEAPLRPRTDGNPEFQPRQFVAPQTPAHRQVAPNPPQPAFQPQPAMQPQRPMPPQPALQPQQPAQPAHPAQPAVRAQERHKPQGQDREQRDGDHSRQRP